MDVAWAYCKYGISYYGLQEMLDEHRVSVVHSTIRCRVEFYVSGKESAFGYFGSSFLSAIRGTLPKRARSNSGATPAGSVLST